MELSRKKNKDFNANNINMAKLTPYIFILPAFISIILLFIYPIMYGMGISFFETNLINKWDFVWLKNYTAFITNKDFINSMIITAKFTIIVVAMHFVIGTLLALGLNRRAPFISLFRVILILPWVFPEVVTALIFKWILNPVYGILNHTLLELGIIEENMSWLGDEKYAFFIVVIVCIWKGFPLVMINVLAALQSVDTEVYEAAKVDGANKIQTLFRITLPIIKPVIASVLVLDTVWWFKHYTMISLLTQGGPNNSTSVVSVEIYKRAFSYFDFGSAAAMSVVVFLVCLVINKLLRRVVRDDEE